MTDRMERAVEAALGVTSDHDYRPWSQIKAAMSTALPLVGVEREDVARALYNFDFTNGNIEFPAWEHESIRETLRERYRARADAVLALLPKHTGQPQEGEALWLANRDKASILARLETDIQGLFDRPKSGEINETLKTGALGALQHFKDAIVEAGWTEARESVPEVRLLKRPVAFRAKSPLGHWVFIADESAARTYAEKSETEYQGLYVRDGAPLNLSAVPTSPQRAEGENKEDLASRENVPSR